MSKLALAGLLVMVLMASCSDQGTAQRDPAFPEEKAQDIEVSPNKWVTIRRVSHTVDKGVSRSTWLKCAPEMPLNKDKEWYWMSVPYNGTDVVWVKMDIPISLREFEGCLYVIGFDRQTDGFGKFRLHYYRQKGQLFEQIPADQYPRQVATQNMWMKTKEWITLNDHSRYRELDITRTLSIEHAGFPDTLTARIWWSLEKGQEQYREGTIVSGDLIREYMRKHSPMALPTIVREDEGGQPSSPPPVPK